MKMYRDEKKQGLQMTILLIELFTIVKPFDFWTFFSANKLLNEMNNMRKF